MKNITIRAATETDLEAILEIYNEVLVNSTATFEEELRPLSEFTVRYRDKKSAGIPWLVADHDGHVVGYGTYGNFRSASGYKCTVEHSLHVTPKMRGQGIGT